MRIFLKSFCFLFASTSVAAFLLFYGTKLMMGNNPHHSPILITDGYHGYYLWEISEHPFAFLLTIAFFTSVLGTLWITKLAPKYTHYHGLQLLIIPWIALILTSPVWGLIWSIYRWPPQSFTDSSVMMLFYRHDAIVGLSLGWLSAIISFPINVLSYIIVCILLSVGKRTFIDKSVTL
jgi:hypothetical protein